MNQPTYCYSLNGEEYTGEFPSREMALQEGLAEALSDQSTGTVWTGRCVPAAESLAAQSDSIAHDILEYVNEQLHEEFGGDDAAVELHGESPRQLGELIVKFLLKHASFNRFGVDEIEEHPAGVLP